MEHIYLYLTKSKTTVAKAIRLATKKPYSHVSISDSIDKFYSFARTYKHFMLPATFNPETIDKGVFGDTKVIPCEIYDIPVTSEQKAVYDALINHFITNRKKYSYNTLGLFLIPLRINYSRKNKYLCSQFVAHILDVMGFNLGKPVFMFTPEDFRIVFSKYLIYQGELKEFVHNVKLGLLSSQGEIYNDVNQVSLSSKS